MILLYGCHLIVSRRFALCLLSYLRCIVAMGRTDNCGKCTLPIRALEDRIECDGSCHSVFHLSCTTVNAFDVRRCLENENLLWMCNCCLSLFRKQTNSTATTDSKNEGNIKLESVVCDLQKDMEEIKKQISNFKSSTCQIHSSEINTHDGYLTSTPQADANDASHGIKLSSTWSSTINESYNSKLFTGKKVENNYPNGRHKFWIFFTGVAKHVSCSEFSKMVSNCLKLDEPPEVIKLVPRWRNHQDLHHVSFKVGVDHKYKETAFLESTWPLGLLFREFVPRKLCIWEPWMLLFY